MKMEKKNQRKRKKIQSRNLLKIRRMYLIKIISNQKAKIKVLIKIMKNQRKTKKNKSKKAKENEKKKKKKDKKKNKKKKKNKNKKKKSKKNKKKKKSTAEKLAPLLGILNTQISNPLSNPYNPMIDSGNVKIPEHNDENPTLNDYEELIPIKKDSHQNAHSIYHSPKTQDIFENSLISNSQDSSIPYHNYMNLSGNQGYDSMAAFNNYNPVGSQGSQSILGNNNSNNQMNLANIIKAAQVLKILEEQKKSQRKKA